MTVERGANGLIWDLGQNSEEIIPKLSYKVSVCVGWRKTKRKGIIRFEKAEEGERARPGMVR